MVVSKALSRLLIPLALLLAQTASAQWFWGDPDPWRPRDNPSLLCIPEKSSSYQGEPVSVSYYLRSSEIIGSFMTSGEQDYPGYGKTVLEQPTVLNYENISYNGSSYRAALIKRIAVFPQEPGRLRLPSIDGTISYYSIYSYGDRNISSTEAWINVRPLPPGRPADFSGAVGNFNLTQSFSEAKITRGEALTCTIKLSGQGNFSNISAPAFPRVRGIQISDPSVQDNLSDPIRGSRFIVYTLLPQSSGTFAVPGFTFSWFNTSSGTYRTFRGSSLSLEVAPSSVFSQFSGLLGNKRPSSLGKMLPRAAYPDFRPLASRFWFWLALALLLGTLPVSWWLARERNLRETDPRAWESKNAARALDRDLASLGAESPEFFAAAEKALLRFLSARLSIPQGLTLSELAVALGERGVPEDTVARLESFLRRCQESRFRPREIDSGSDGSARSELQSLAASLKALKTPEGEAGR